MSKQYLENTFIYHDMEVTSTRSLSKTLKTKSRILCLESLSVLHYLMLIGGIWVTYSSSCLCSSFFMTGKKLRRKEEVGV